MDDDMNGGSDDVLAYMDSVPLDDGMASLEPARVTSVVDMRGVPIIRDVAGELHNIASEAEAALIRGDAPFYVRGEKLVRPVVDEMPAAHGQRTKVARLAQVTPEVMIDHLSRSASWIKWNARKKDWVPCDPSSKAAAVVLSRDGEWQFRRLSGVITTPTLRPDGTILSDAGYDEATQLLLLDPPRMPPIPERPTRASAEKALDYLDRLLDEFPFIDSVSRTVALSALITPVVRGAVPVTPMHATTAPVPGSGKSYIIDLASAINSGERAPVLTAGRNEEETEKRLVSALLAGQTIVSIDNVNGELGGDALCQMIERPVVSVRALGGSVLTKVESRACMFATGNNIQLVGDMTRRVLLCSLDPDMERPELREFRQNPFDQVIAARGRYVAAALTVVRAYVVAGRPGQCKPLASFEEWSGLVRSALVWLGRDDPCASMDHAKASDPITSALTAVFGAWHSVAGEAAFKSGEIKDVALQTDTFGSRLHPSFYEALCDVAEDRRQGGINAKSLGRWLGRYKGRVAAGLKLVDAGQEHGQALWKVIKL